jgi:hypothetical protein
MRKTERERINFKRLVKKIDNKFLFNTIKKLFFFLSKFKSIYLLKKINSYHNYSYFNNNNNELTKLCEKYKTDKGSISVDDQNIWGDTPHTYSNYYYSLFNHFKDDVKLVFECGIGENIPGASLRVWKNYFINAQIIGADIDKNILFSEERILTFYCDQLDVSSINLMWEKINLKNFDIIIDDGLHATEANVNLFLSSFNLLKKNGIYIIEDVHNRELIKIEKQLRRFNPEILMLGAKSNRKHDNNLVVIRNN